MGVTRTFVNEPVNDKRGITIDSAIMLSKVFNTSPQFWLNLHIDNELWKTLHDFLTVVAYVCMLNIKAGWREIMKKICFIFFAVFIAIFFNINVYADGYVNIYPYSGKSLDSYQYHANFEPNSKVDYFHYVVHEGGSNLYLKYYTKDKDENICYCRIEAKGWTDGSIENKSILKVSGAPKWNVLIIEGNLCKPSEVSHFEYMVRVDLKQSC